MFSLRALAALVVFACACDDGRGNNTGGSDLAVPPGTDLATSVVDLAIGTCSAPATPAGSEVAIAPAFQPSYTAYALGPVPGVPSPLGGIVAKLGDPSTLLVAGDSEHAGGAIYAIKVTRDGCGHILAFDGTATKVADAANVDANLAYGPGSGGTLVYTEWPLHHMSQLLPGATMPSKRTDLQPLGTSGSGDSGPGGVAFVPPGMAAEGQLRIVTWSGGVWYHVPFTLTGGLYTFGTVTEKLRLDHNPGGFAYVPAGSPGFTTQSIIVSEWSVGGTTNDRVAVYDVDAEGDPIKATRREFFTKFPRPWGAYFDPMTGDYLFLTWSAPGGVTDKVYLVQGFVPPPPIL